MYMLNCALTICSSVYKMIVFMPVYFDNAESSTLKYWL